MRIFEKNNGFCPKVQVWSPVTRLSESNIAHALKAWIPLSKTGRIAYGCVGWELYGQVFDENVTL